MTDFRGAMNSRRNRLDKKDSLEKGHEAENSFAEIAGKKGWEVIPAPRNSDIHEHWDFLLKKGEKEYKVDVKARKRIKRSNASVQDKWLWIELHGVREDEPGWLYGSKADLIAFETKNSFVIAPRTELIELVHKLVDFNSLASRPEDARYKIYSRSGRHDKITLIETEKLKAVKFFEWSKDLFHQTFQVSKPWKVYDKMSGNYWPPFEERRFYHIYNRGNNKEEIFFREGNFRYFLKEFDEYLSNLLDVYAFCLLPNHFHFLIRVKEDLTAFRNLEGHNASNRNPVTQTFTNFFSTYTKAINKQQNRTGSLLQENLKRKLIDEEKYLTEIVFYIHNNPVHHNICKKLDEYVWSSYARILNDRTSKLKKSEVLDWFGGKQSFIEYHQLALVDSKEAKKYLIED